MAIATIETPATDTRYGLTEAADYLTARLGFYVSPRAFRAWVEKGAVPFRRNPGPRGHYFWTRPMLDQIVQEMVQVRRITGDKQELSPRTSESHSKRPRRGRQRNAQRHGKVVQRGTRVRVHHAGGRD